MITTIKVYKLALVTIITLTGTVNCNCTDYYISHNWYLEHLLSTFLPRESYNEMPSVLHGMGSKVLQSMLYCQPNLTMPKLKTVPFGRMVRYSPCGMAYLTNHKDDLFGRTIIIQVHPYFWTNISYHLFDIDYVVSGYYECRYIAMVRTYESNNQSNIDYYCGKRNPWTEIIPSSKVTIQIQTFFMVHTYYVMLSYHVIKCHLQLLVYRHHRFLMHGLQAQLREMKLRIKNYNAKWFIKARISYRLYFAVTLCVKDDLRICEGPGTEFCHEIASTCDEKTFDFTYFAGSIEYKQLTLRDPYTLLIGYKIFETELEILDLSTDLTDRNIHVDSGPHNIYHRSWVISSDQDPTVLSFHISDFYGLTEDACINGGM